MPLRKMNADEFARRLKYYSNLQDRRFAFFLGAGCSITSGIPGAASLVKDSWLPQLRDLRAPNEKDIDAWAKEEFSEYDPDFPAGSYSSVIKEVFEQPGDRQREIERICQNKFPGFGYGILATLIARYGGCFNVVITTNFDDLVSDALYLFTRARPLVIVHESLAGFIRPTRTRPLIVKLHGDAHLDPQNTAVETEKLLGEVESQVKNLLHDRALIFIGYGGNDKGIKTMLSALPEDALHGGVYWISGSEPQGLLSQWLEDRDAIWVEKSDFDEMMLLIRDAFELPHPDKKPIDDVFQHYNYTYKNLSKRIRSAPDNSINIPLKKAVDRADSDFGVLTHLQEAKKLEESDCEGAKDLYQDAIEKYPDSAILLGDYARFLEKNCQEYDLAEKNYHQAYLADPHHVNTLINYAGFLLSREEKGKGGQILEKTISFLPDPEIPDLAVKSWFFAFAHWSKKRHGEALHKLKRTLLDGDRSPGWKFSANIDQARKENHPDIEWLEKLAAVINEDEDISILDEWDKWKDA